MYSIYRLYGHRIYGQIGYMVNFLPQFLVPFVNLLVKIIGYMVLLLIRSIFGWSHRGPYIRYLLYFISMQMRPRCPPLMQIKLEYLSVSKFWTVCRDERRKIPNKCRPKQFLFKSSRQSHFTLHPDPWRCRSRSPSPAFQSESGWDNILTLCNKFDFKITSN